MLEHIVDKLREYLFWKVMAHILINLELRAWNSFRRMLSVLNGKQLILSAMQDQGWHIDSRDLVGSVTSVQYRCDLIWQCIRIKAQLLQSLSFLITALIPRAAEAAFRL